MARKGPQATEVDRVIGVRIHTLRMAMRLSRQKLAERIGVTHQQLQKYEKGVNRISAGRLLTIAEVFQKPVVYFLPNNSASEESYDLREVERRERHQRMSMELSTHFLRISNPETRLAVIALVRSLADDDGTSSAHHL
jgi:transcriptional regulator with XRE-family HTH domain